MRGTLPRVPGLVAARLLRPNGPGRAFLSIVEFANSDAYLQYRDSAWFTAAHQRPDHAPIEHNRLTTYETILEL
jgi:heme-degrading monooxygenase HmoA